MKTVRLNKIVYFIEQIQERNSVFERLHYLIKTYFENEEAENVAEIHFLENSLYIKVQGTNITVSQNYIIIGKDEASPMTIAIK